MKIKIAKLLAGLAVFTLVTTLVTLSAQNTAVTVPIGTASPDLRIAPGDLLQVTVYGAPDFDKQVRVSNTGEISLPMVEIVKVAGLTIREAEMKIAKLLNDASFFNNPSVSIFAKEYATAAVSVLGEVMKPGIYPLMGPHTLFDALSAAGGTTPKAGKDVTITRRGSQLTQTVALSDTNGGMTGNIDLSPGDTVVVSKAPIVYVIGDVREPSAVVMDNTNLTVMKALALAKGTNPTAALGKVRIVRASASGPSEIPVPLKSIMAAKTHDMPLQGDDVLFIPTSNAKLAGRTVVDALTRATGALVYRRF